MYVWSKRLAIVLAVLSGLGFIVSNIKINPAILANRITEAMDEHYSKSTTIVNRYLNGNQDIMTLTSLDENPFSIELFKLDSVIYWNKAVSVSSSTPSDIILLDKFTVPPLTAKITLDIHAFNSVYPQKIIALTSDTSANTLYFKNHKIGFKIIQAEKYPGFKTLAWICFLLSVLLGTLYFSLIIKKRINHKKSIVFPLALLTAILGTSFGFHYFPPFINLLKGISKGQNALDDFKIGIGNYVIGLIACVIFVYFLPEIIKYIKRYFNSRFHLVGILTGAFTWVAFAFFIYVVQSFVLNQNVNLEIESMLKFDIVSFILITGFIISMMLIFQSTQLLYEWLNEGNLKLNQKILFSLIGWSIGFLVTLLIFPLYVPLLKFTIFIVAYSLIIDAYAENQDKKITYLLWWMVMFSGFLAVVLFYFGLKKDVSERTAFLTDYYAKPDDAIIKTMMDIQDSLLAKNVYNNIASLDNSARLDKKDLFQFMFNQVSPVISDSVIIDIELFDKNTGTTVFSNYFADFYKLNQTYTNAYKVNRQVYHNPFEDKYITRLEVIRPFPVNASWYLFLIAQKVSAVSKERHTPQNFSYAVFSKDQLIEKTDNFQNTPDLNKLVTIQNDTILDGYSLVVSIPSQQYKIVSWKKISGLIKPISLFSFIFSWSGIIIFILTLFNTKYGFLPANFNLKFGERSSLKTKIQLAIIILIVVTFLIIGSITAIYFKNLIEVNQLTKNKEETVTIIHNVRSSVQNLADDEFAAIYLSSKLNELSYIHDKDLSLYDAAGRLMASTSMGDVNYRIPFYFWKNNGIRANNELSSYHSTLGHEYIALFLNENRAFAYLDIEYHNHGHSAENILDFLSTILNAYIFLFLIAGAIAITIANSITQPLTKLAEKLKRFKLGKSNELLEWKSNDEIGTLIDEYNNLTQELEDSVELLAKTERDIAWREMAKQVAHEIKNPLTPMKLNIQYLERTTNESPERAHEMIKRISSSLIEQIDNLSQIANEFSNFAAMPQASNEKISLNEIVEAIHDLFRKRDDMDINMIEPIDDLYIFADKNHLVRILNNLLKNAIQAIPDNRRGKIEIELKRQGNDAIIRISDNGTGIPEHMKDKVFTPNFTTKSSGTGLGLAISANMIESFNGRIYFETHVGKGTDFFVSVPLMRLEDYNQESYRVTLD